MEPKFPQGPADQTPEEFNPMYEAALRAVCEVGKASTSTLQRKLRLGYGRAKEILDRMYEDGIIGPPNGATPREILKSWEEIEEYIKSGLGTEIIQPLETDDIEFFSVSTVKAKIEEILKEFENKYDIESLSVDPIARNGVAISLRITRKLTNKVSDIELDIVTAGDSLARSKYTLDGADVLTGITRSGTELGSILKKLGEELLHFDVSPKEELILERATPEKDTEAEKIQAIAKLREAIERAQKIIEEETEKIEERERRLIEIRAQKKAENLEAEKADYMFKIDPPISLEQALMKNTEYRYLQQELGDTARWHLLKRRGLSKKINQVLEKIQKEVENDKQRVGALEKDKIKNPFKYFLLGKMSEENRRRLYGTSITAGELTRRTGESGLDIAHAWEFKKISKQNDFIINFSPNGYYLKVSNAAEIGIDEASRGEVIENPKAKYESEISYEEGLDLLKQKAKLYQSEQVIEFNISKELEIVESLKTVEEKKEYLDNKRVEKINNLKKVRADIAHNTEQAQSTFDWKREMSQDNLKKLKESPLDYYTILLDLYKQKPEDYYRDTEAEFQKVIDQIKLINAKYDKIISSL